MRVAITGSTGRFGYGLVQVFRETHTVFPLSHQELDITRKDLVESVLGKIRPEVVIHPAAIPDLDVCESDPAKAFLVNVLGTRFVVDAARRLGARVATISTDAVFDGEQRTPYAESDPARPPTVYGRTKLRAERITLEKAESWVFRVSVLFGPGKENFIEKGLRQIASGADYIVAADQVGSASYTLDAARKIREVIEAGRFGLYHLCNAGACSRLELARRAAEAAGLDPARVVGRPSGEMGRRAVRLPYAVMEMAALKREGFALPRPWPEALDDYVSTLPAFSESRSAAT